MKPTVALFLPALLIVSEASAQRVFETQAGSRVESCSEAIANAESSNGFLLFLGANSCYREGLEHDGAFLSWAGHNRYVLDRLMFEASGEDAQRARAELTDLLSASSQAGGMALVELYRDDTALRRLIARLWDWRPRLSEDYDPGWAHRETPSVETYGFYLSLTKPIFVGSIELQTLLLRNDEYYAATMELAEIRQRSPSLEVDSDRVRAEQLQARLAEIRKGLAPPAGGYQYRPDPNASFRQVFMGVNGPSRNSWLVFATRDEVLESWLARALSSEQLGSLLEQIDFEKQVLVSFNVGNAYTSTGKVYITHLELDSEMAVIRLHAEVGQNELSCEYPRGSSYPFALAVADRASAGASGDYIFGSATFRDGCQEPASASPNDP